MNTTNLTPRRKAILAEIRKSNGRSPSYRDLMQATLYRSSSGMQVHLNALRRHGYLEFDPFQARTLTLTGKGLLAAQGYELAYLCDQDGIREVR